MRIDHWDKVNNNSNILLHLKFLILWVQRSRFYISMKLQVCYKTVMVLYHRMLQKCFCIVALLPQVCNKILRSLQH